LKLLTTAQRGYKSSPLELQRLTIVLKHPQSSIEHNQRPTDTKRRLRDILKVLMNYVFIT